MSLTHSLRQFILLNKVIYYGNHIFILSMFCANNYLRAPNLIQIFNIFKDFGSFLDIEPPFLRPYPIQIFIFPFKNYKNNRLNSISLQLTIEHPICHSYIFSSILSTKSFIFAFSKLIHLRNPYLSFLTFLPIHEFKFIKKPFHFIFKR